MKTEFLESDNYPAEQTLKAIAEWPHLDFCGLIEFIAPYFNRYGRIQQDHDGTVALATGGWSGNEDIIYALKQNHVIWAIRWMSSSRGGLNTFELKFGESPCGFKPTEK